MTPLAAPSLCFDLRRDCSLVEHLVTQGRPTYLLEYGQVSFKNRRSGMEHWVDEVLPEAIRAVSEHSGGRGVHLVGWSLGGIFALLVAADRQDLPIASLTVVGLPGRRDQGAARGAGAAAAQPDPGPRASSPGPTGPRRRTDPARQLGLHRRLRAEGLTKPLAVLTHLDDTDYLAQMEAVTRFMSNMTAYPGRTFGQLYHRFVKGNALARAAWRSATGRSTSPRSVPVLVFAGNTDGIAPLPAVRAVVPLLTGSPQVRFEVVPGGHLGMLTGRAARGTTWAAIDEWVAEWSAGPLPARKRAARKTREEGAREEGSAIEGDSEKPAKKAPPRRRPRPRRSAPTRRAATARRARGRWASGDGPTSPATRRGCRAAYASATAAGRSRPARSARCPA